MLEKAATRTSVAMSVAVCLAAAGFGASRGFGAFLLSVVALPLLIIFALISLATATAENRSGVGVKVSALLILLVPAAFYAGQQSRDPLLFLGWSVGHRAALKAAASTDSILLGWDSWGMAGMENDSYIVSDKFDHSSTVESAERWRKRMELDCPIAATKRMQKGIYLVTTYNCPFDGVAIPND
jgi:hypothetical protein